MFPPIRYSAIRLRWVALVVLAIGTAASARALDFNGDGVADMLLRDRANGDFRLSVSVMDGATPGTVKDSRSVFLAEAEDRDMGFDVRTGDFNGDGRSDILTRDLGSGSIRIRLMNGVTVLERRTVTELTDAGESQLLTVADFDGDGQSDLLLRKPAGVWSIVLMDGTAVRELQSGDLPVASRPTLVWVSSADLDGDGKADLLLRDRNTLEWRLLLMNGRSVRSHLPIEGLPENADWQLQTVADFNRDQRADLLFRNRLSGDWFGYFMDAAQILPSSGRMGISSNLAFELESVGDMNGDGYLDVLLRRAETGRWYVNFLQERWRLAESGLAEIRSNPDWRVARIADFSGYGAAQALVMDGAAGWLLVDLINPEQPSAATLDIGESRNTGIACEPPSYYQFGAPARPAELGLNALFLRWKTPVSRDNGEPLCKHELAGYVLYSRASNSGDTERISITDPNSDTWQLNNLAPDTYRVSLYALDSNGLYSKTARVATLTLPL